MKPAYTFLLFSIVKLNNSSSRKISASFATNLLGGFVSNICPFLGINSLNTITSLTFFNIFFLAILIGLKYFPKLILFISIGSLFINLECASCLLDVRSKDTYNLATHLQLTS